MMHYLETVNCRMELKRSCLSEHCQLGLAVYLIESAEDFFGAEFCNRKKIHESCQVLLIQSVTGSLQMESKMRNLYNSIISFNQAK